MKHNNKKKNKNKNKKKKNIILFFADARTENESAHSLRVRHTYGILRRSPVSLRRSGTLLNVDGREYLRFAYARTPFSFLAFRARFFRSFLVLLSSSRRRCKWVMVMGKKGKEERVCVAGPARRKELRSSSPPLIRIVRLSVLAIIPLPFIRLNG